MSQHDVGAKAGSLYWITGLSGAGKTTIAKELHAILQQKGGNVVMLDGDILRSVFQAQDQYSREGRLSLALQYARLCKMLTDQGLTVICATISMFKECHQYNREHINGYKEIYLRVPMEILRKRDTKNIYSQASAKGMAQVVGVDIEYDEPKNADLIIENDGRRSPQQIAREIDEHYYQ